MKPSTPPAREKHTPVPWAYCKREDVSGVPAKESTIPFAIYKPLRGACVPIADICSNPYNIHGDKNNITDEAVEEMEANAQFIVSACNSHAALVAALEAVSRLDYLQEHNALAEKVRQALNLAKYED